MKNNRYGKLVVKEEAHTHDRNGTYWLCKCDCGNIVTIRGFDLINGKSKTCGCGRSKPQGVASLNSLLRIYKLHAKERNHYWKLSKEQFKFLTKQNCFYCGIFPSNEHKMSKYGSYVYSGIDRIDNEKGYIVDNVVPCCRHCNLAKRTLGLDEFIEWVHRVHEHLALDKTDEVWYNYLHDEESDTKSEPEEEKEV